MAPFELPLPPLMASMDGGGGPPMGSLVSENGTTGSTGEASTGAEEEAAVAEDAGAPMAKAPQGPYDPDSGVPALSVWVDPKKVGVIIDGREMIGRARSFTGLRLPAATA